MNTIQLIEKMKLKYPELKIKETNEVVKDNLKKLYQLFGSVFDGNLLRL